MESVMKLTGAQILVETLISLGADVIFGYPGGAVLDIYNELYNNSDRIAHVLSAHEQGAAHAADGYARVSGKTGVVLATSGPGATNLVTGIANAYLDSVPMLALTGNVSVSLLGKDSFQEVDIVGITQPIVKHSYILRDIKDLELTVRKAYRLANEGRPGPVLIDIPKSVQQEKYEYSGEPYSPPAQKGGAEPNIAEAVELIKHAKRPYLYLGGGVITAGAGETALKLAEHISAPIGLSMMGLSSVPTAHPLNLGMSGMHGLYASTVAQSKADLVIAAGVRFSDRATGSVDKYTRNCKVIHIDIDNAELGKNVRPDVSIRGDVKSILSRILSETERQEHPQWISEVEELKKVVPATGKSEFNPTSIIKTVAEHVSEDAVIATDVGQHQMWVAQNYPFKKPRTLLTSGGLGTMGFGLGAAIGGCIASGGKRTVHFTSDGSFGMNLNELATAVSQNLPIVTVILNNGTLGMVRQWQTVFYDKKYSQTTLDRKTDFVKLAEAFGANGKRVTDLAGLKEALSSLENGVPTVIDCIIDIDEMVLPMIPPGGGVENIRIS